MIMYDIFPNIITDITQSLFQYFITTHFYQELKHNPHFLVWDSLLQHWMDTEHFALLSTQTQLD